MTYTRGWASFLTLAAAALTLLPMNARAQGDTNPPPAPADQQGQQPKTETRGAEGNQIPEIKPPAAPTPAYPVDAQIRAAGKAVPWIGSGTPFRIGPISLGGIDLIGVYDQFHPANDPQVRDTRLALLRANIVFAKTFKKSLFVVQYVPELAMLNGEVRGGADGNHDFTLGQVFDVSPRLSITLKDDIGYVRTRQMFPDRFLLIDRESGGVLQNYLLESTGSTFVNAFSAVFNYKLTPRLTLTAAPGYYYADAEFAGGSYSTEASKNTFSLTYAISPRRNLGLFQTADYQHGISPAPSNFLYHVTGLFYSEQFTPTLWVTGRAGLEEGTNLDVHTGASTWGAAGSFTLLKVFSHSDFALAYNRATTITTFKTNRQVESADISYGFVASRRLKWTNGVGYFHELGPAPRVSGKYAISTMEYHLAGGFSLLTSYSRRNQNSTTPALISGDRNTFLMGIRWEPAGVPGH
jgi:hypothetical protein